MSMNENKFEYNQMLKMFLYSEANHLESDKYRCQLLL